MSKSKVVELMSFASKKQVRIVDDEVNAGGGHGPYVKFKFIKKEDKTVLLQSCKDETKYIALGPKGKIFVGKGGKHCEFKAKKHEPKIISLKSAHHKLWLGFKHDGNFEGVKYDTPEQETRLKISKV